MELRRGLKGGGHCVLDTCKSTCRKPVHFFPIPQSTKNVRREWIRLIRRARNEPDWDPTPGNESLCDLHFKHEDIIFQVKPGPRPASQKSKSYASSRLDQNVIPSMYLEPSAGGSSSTQNLQKVVVPGPVSSMEESATSLETEGKDNSELETQLLTGATDEAGKNIPDDKYKASDQEGKEDTRKGSGDGCQVEDSEPKTQVVDGKGDELILEDDSDTNDEVSKAKDKTSDDEAQLLDDDESKDGGTSAKTSDIEASLLEDDSQGSKAEEDEVTKVPIDEDDALLLEDDPLTQGTENALVSAKKKTPDGEALVAEEEDKKDSDDETSLLDEETESKGETSVTEGDKDKDATDDDIQMLENDSEGKDEGSKTGGEKDKDMTDDDIQMLDNGEEGKKASDAESEDEMPMIRLNSSIFEAQGDDDDEEANIDDDDEMEPIDIQSMMEVEMGEDDEDQFKPTQKKQRKSFDDKLAEEAPVRRTPRRAAAQVAANTIKQITSQEEDDIRVENDPTFRTSVRRPSSSSTLASSSGPVLLSPSPQNKPDGEKKRCHQCKIFGPSLIVVRQYGTDIHLCSNKCFNAFRNPDPTFRPMPCAKCGVVNRDNENSKLYFWETMNFCSDLCVGNFQIQVGANCSTCSKKTPWSCMGKYCVRFGSDVRQFCTATCLESYKKSARVCFHCQLDIKRLGNVVLANLPSKATTKEKLQEFCSQDCVEMYVDQNIRGGTSTKPTVTALCFVCKQSKVLFKELVTPVTNYKTCSPTCWDRVLESNKVGTPTKCETCTKYINMDTISISPSYYVATEKKAHGFCSATCKNVYVLKSRQILSCTSCKVKKYNYDLVQYVTGRVTNYAVCSLNCLPKPSQYIVSLRNSLFPIGSASILSENRRRVIPEVVPVITSTGSIGLAPRAQGTSNGNVNGHNREVPIVELNGDDESDYGVEYEGTDVTVRQADDDDIIEIRDEDIEADDFSTETQAEEGTQTGNTTDGDEEDVPLEDERWLDMDEFVIFMPTIPPNQRNKACQVRPIKFTKESQTDSEELWKMPRVEMKDPEPEEKVRYVPVPIPYPILIPFPFYALNTPVPVPFPIGIPIPIPIPLNMNLVPTPDAASSIPALPAIESPPAEKEDRAAEQMTVPTVEVDDVEMMDTSESSEATEFFTFTNSPMSVGSPSVPSTSVSVGPGSPLVTHGGKIKASRADQGIRAWKILFPDEKELLNLTPADLSEKLVEFVQRATRPKGDRYEPDVLFSFVLGIQQYFKKGKRRDSFFYDSVYSPFVEALTAYAEQEASRGVTIARVDEEYVWDLQELGPNSGPEILLFTLVYLIYKHFHLKTWQEFAALEFSQVQIKQRPMKAFSDRMEQYIEIQGINNFEGEPLQLPERHDVPARCPVKLLQFYKTKCPSTEGTLFKGVNPSLSPGHRMLWFTSESLNQFDLYRMLVRAMMMYLEPTD